MDLPLFECQVIFNFRYYAFSSGTLLKIKIVLTLFKIKLNFFHFSRVIFTFQRYWQLSFSQHPFSKIKTFDFYFFARFLIFSTTSILSISLTLLEIRGAFHQKPQTTTSTPTYKKPTQNSITLYNLKYIYIFISIKKVIE